MNTAIANIDLWSMVFAFLFIVPPLIISWWLGLAEGKRILISTVRMGVQLGFVGFYLHYIFELNNVWINIAYLFVMTIIASFSSVNSAGIQWKFFVDRVFIAMLLPLVMVVLYFHVLVVRLNDLFDAQYLIPIGGMILGNTLKASVIALDKFYASLKQKNEIFQAMVAYGADYKQALRPFYRDAIKAAINPILATMATVGLVSLPGMMTGQILSGAMPIIAIKYQIAIMVAIFCNNIITVVLLLWFVGLRSFDGFGNLRSEIFSGKQYADVST